MIGFGFGFRHRAQTARVQAQLAATLAAAGGECAMLDYSQAFDDAGTWTASDLSGNGNDHTQATADNQPSLTGTFDASDMAEQSIPTDARTYSVFLGFTKLNTSTSGVMITDSANTNLLMYNSGNATALSNVTADGVPMATRGALFTALDDDAGHIVAITAMAIAARTALRIGRTAISLTGDVRKVVVLDETALDTNTQAARDLAALWVAQ